MKSFQPDRDRNRPLRAEATPALPPSSRMSDRAETLLVVDDDPMVLDLEAQFLRMQGYTVLEAENAAEAMRLAGETPTIHLLITDLLMSEVDGLELTRRFRVVHPKTPVLMVSGSLPLLRVRSEPDLDHFEFLAKPFQFDELLRKVRTLLEATASPAPRKAWCCD